MGTIDLKKLSAENKAEYFAFGAQEMHQLGTKLADYFTLPSVVYLSVDLGAGKTTLVQGITQFFNYEGVVSSPSYNLIHEYPSSLNGNEVNIAHLDLYRIEDPEELEMLGLADLLNDNSLLFIEWPEKGADRVPECHFSVDISIVSESGKVGRRVVVSRC